MMSVSMLSICFISVCLYEFNMCNAHKLQYRMKENSTLRNTYRRITDGERIACVAECMKDPWCLSAVYDEGLRTCDLSSYSPDETMSQTETQSGTRIYYQNVQELTAVAGIKAWQSSTMDAQNGSFAIDRSFRTTILDCFHSQMADGNYLIVELESMSNLVHVDIFFRTDLLYDVRNREITVLVANSQAELDITQAKFCGHYNGPPADKYLPGRVKCPPNTTGKYVKFLQTIPEYLNICEVADVKESAIFDPILATGDNSVRAAKVNKKQRVAAMMGNWLRRLFPCNRKHDLID